MITKLSNLFYGLLALILVSLSTFLFFIPIFIIGLLKLIPFKRWRIMCANVIDKLVVLWTDINNTYIKWAYQIEWKISGLNNLLPTPSWYLVMSNHQSWLDIVVLQHAFNRKIPVLKFFIKNQLKWVPLLGFAWWAMGCPFMKRYTKEYLHQYPHKKGKDLVATQQAINAFQNSPTTIINFIEGTRFTPEKQKVQQSPYQHLLKPRAGGISYVISAMAGKITHLIDATLIYPTSCPSLWDFLCNRVNTIIVHVQHLPIPVKFLSDALVTNEQIQAEFRQWLNQHWAEKDNLINQLKAQPAIMNKA